MPRFLFFLVCLFLLTLSPALCARDPMQWERLHTRSVPTRLLARLGITHITRFGYTRDGNQKNEPDPTFPPGLTDVVPLDATHTLLVRGTATGRVAFRARMTRQDTLMLLPRVHLVAALLPVPVSPVTNGEADPNGPPPATQEAPPDSAATVTVDAPDAPFVVAVPDAAATRLYQVDVDDAPGGYLVRVQMNLVSPTSIGVTTGPSTPPVWSTPQTFRVPANAPAFWKDEATFRDSERRRLHLPAPVAPESDLFLRLVITPIGGPAALPATPPAVVH